MTRYEKQFYETIIKELPKIRKALELLTKKQNNGKNERNLYANVGNRNAEKRETKGDRDRDPQNTGMDGAIQERK